MKKLVCIKKMDKKYWLIGQLEPITDIIGHYETAIVCHNVSLHTTNIIRDTSDRQVNLIEVLSRHEMVKTQFLTNILKTILNQTTLLTSTNCR